MLLNHYTLCSREGILVYNVLCDHYGSEHIMSKELLVLIGKIFSNRLASMYHN